MTPLRITKELLLAVDDIVVNVDMYRATAGYKKLDSKDALHILEARAYLRKARDAAVAFIHSQS